MITTKLSHGHITYEIAHEEAYTLVFFMMTIKNRKLEVWQMTVVLHT